jgi:hypothetical protein
MFQDPTTPRLMPAVAEFYRDTMRELNRNDVPFLVGGAFAFAQYTGIQRNTRDFDIFVKQIDCQRAMEVLHKRGYHTELTFPHWLAKAYFRGDYLDIIYSSGNAFCRVDGQWFKNARMGTVLGMPVKLVPPEEMIWQKVYIMERERFDGADVLHLIRATASQLNWQRLLERVGDHWRVLLSHLILFGFVYPDERTLIPVEVMNALLARLQEELNRNGERSNICQGTLLSRAQYLVDVEAQGYRDARIRPEGNMSEEEVSMWTAPIRDVA